MQKDDKKRAEEIIGGYYRSILSPETEEAVQGWIGSGDNSHAHESIAKLFAENVKPVAAPNENTRRSLDEVHKLLGFPQKRKTPLIRKLMRVAAVLIPAALIGGGVFFVLNDGKVDEPVELAHYTVQIPKGEHTILPFPDGSEIRPGEGSTIQYSEDFLNDRTVYLDGEAYFKVEKKEGQTFTVKTSTITVTVLGTEFHMKADSEAETSEITLTTGKVEVAAEGIENVTLTPGQHLAYHRQHQSVELSEIGEAKLARMRGLSISFSEESTLDDVFHTISAYYHKQLKVVDPNIGLDQTVIIPFSGTETIDEAMSIVKMVTNNSFDYRIEDDTIILTNPNNQGNKP